MIQSRILFSSVGCCATTWFNEITFMCIVSHAVNASSCDPTQVGLIKTFVSSADFCNIPLQDGCGWGKYKLDAEVIFENFLYQYYVDHPTEVNNAVRDSIMVLLALDQADRDRVQVTVSDASTSSGARRLLGSSVAGISVSFSLTSQADTLAFHDAATNLADNPSPIQTVVGARPRWGDPVTLTVVSATTTQQNSSAAGLIPSIALLVALFVALLM